MFEYEAMVIRVVDGDTMVLDLDLGFKVHVEEVVRLARIDAPEVVNYGAGGIVDPARTLIEQTTPPGSVVVASISKAEKYGRWLAEVFYLPGAVDRNEILRGGKCLSDDLMAAGLAKAYDGRRK